MLYEIGLFYPNKETDVQVKISNIPIPANRRRFFFGGKTIPHWNEDSTNTWVKVPVLNGTTKIHLDDSATKDLSNIDETMIFGDEAKTDKSNNYTQYDIYYSGMNSVFSYQSEYYKFEDTSSDDECALIINNLNNMQALILEADISRYTDTSNNQGGIVAINKSDLYLRNRFVVAGSITRIDISSYDNGTDTLIETTSYDIQLNKWYRFISKFSGSKNDFDVIDLTSGNVVSHLTAMYSFTPIYYGLMTGVTSGGIYFKNVFVHKYLPTDPKILYIRPYHHWWLFETFGGITKLFRASVLEALTKSKSNQTNSDEQNTQIKDNPTNVTEENAKEKENVVNSLEENTQSNITEASAEEGIANVANIITDSIESIINEFDFATSSLEQISNTIADKTSAIEANTQNKEFVISTLEKMINEFDFYASACELVQNTIEAKINANEQLTQAKDGKTSTNEQIAYMYEFLTNALENTIKTVKSETTSKETLTKQITDYISSGEFLTHIKQDKISTNEQIAYAYIFATNTLEQISNVRKDIASVQEKLANNQIDIANALEEIYHIDLSARPIFLSSLKAIGTLTTHIKKVF